MSNAVVAIDLVLQALVEANKYAQLVRQSRAEGREISDAELAAARADDDLARSELQASIERRRAGE